ncbi:MAG: hypothetical protein LBN02_02525, partial [Oscillospiraceae bacterium]|nr:hypothetical protein [Oscillospiraceae bacterium]
MPRMVRNIYHRKDGRYEGRYIKDYDGDGGKARYGYVFARSYAEVKERLQTAKSEPPVQIDQPAPRLLPDAIDAYLDSICGSVKQSTLCVYRRQADNIIKPVLGGYSLSQLTSALIQDFIDTQCENGLSAVTVQSVFGLLRSVLKFAGVEVPCVVLPKREKHEAEFFTVEEQKRLESTALRVSEFDHLAIMLCLYTGIR